MEHLTRAMDELRCEDIQADTEDLDTTVNTAEGEEDTYCGGDDVCAICLGNTEPADFATVKGCEHTYCVHCILQWAQTKEAPWCPQCKKPFNYLYCHRLLDGTLSDVPVEESVCLLKRATWFVDHVKVLEKGKAVCSATADTAVMENTEWTEMYDDLDEDEDEEIEKYYFSSAAGRARIVIGNRRLGENGFLKAGRVYARPTPTPPPASTKGKGKGGSTSSSSTPVPTSGSKHTVAGSTCVGASSSQAGTDGGSSASSSKQGRRAKRNAKRLAVDADEDW